MLRDEMCNWLSGDLTGLDRYLPEDKIRFLVDRQLALIEGQRCEWTLGKFGWEFSCGGKTHYSKTQFEKFCHNCGKRIEVKDAKR
jgi:hypothetical protein